MKILDKKLKDDKNKIDKLKIQIVEDSTRFNLKLDTKKTSYTNENFKLIKEKSIFRECLKSLIFRKRVVDIVGSS